MKSGVSTIDTIPIEAAARNLPSEPEELIG